MGTVDLDQVCPATVSPAQRANNPPPTREQVRARLADYAASPQDCAPNRIDMHLFNAGLITVGLTRTVRPAQHRRDGDFTIRTYEITPKGRRYLVHLNEVLTCRALVPAYHYITVQVGPGGRMVFTGLHSACTFATPPTWDAAQWISRFLEA